MGKWRKGKATVALLMLAISVVCAAPTSFSGVVQAQPLTLHLVIDSEDIDAHSEIASSIETELAKIGIDVIIDPRDKATLASTVWGSEWDKTWDEEPGNGWDMVWYEFPHPKSWALIISGSTGLSFSNNTEYMYHALNQCYNFDGIYYLDVDTSRPGVNASATIDNVRQAITGWLASHSGINDIIFIYFTSHGGGYYTGYNHWLPYSMQNGRYDVSGDEGNEVQESTFREWCWQLNHLYDIRGDNTPPWDCVRNFDADPYIEIDLDSNGTIDFQLDVLEDLDGDGWSDDILLDPDIDDCCDIAIAADVNHDGTIDNFISDGEDTDRDGWIVGLDLDGNGFFNDWVGIDECMQVQDGWYWDDELATDLDTLNYDRLIFVRQGCIEGDEGCFGGGLIDDISAPFRIIMTASNETSPSYGDLDGDGYSEWSEAFIDALHGEETHWDNGVVHESPPVLVDADFDDNGFVSMGEAWDYAWDHDNARLFGRETPWLDDNWNGKPTYVGERDVWGTPDGYIASGAYLERDLGIHFYSWATPSNGGYNIMGWNSTYSDEFLIRINSTDPEMVKYYFDAWQKEWMYDPPGIIIYYPEETQCARGIAFNLHHPVLRNRYVRQAIARAIPYGDIFKDILQSDGIEAVPGIAPIHYSSEYFNTELDIYTYDIAKAQRYLDMWLYAQTGFTDPADYNKGCVGDANFDGKVDLDDLYYWMDEYGNAPSNDIDADFDNSNDVTLADYELWYANVGKEYPFSGANGAGSSSSPESPEEPPATPPESEGPYVKVYVDQPLGYIPGQPPHRTVTADVIIEVTNITDNSAEGIVGWGIYVQVDPDILEFDRVEGAAPGYFLCNFSDWYFYDYPSLITFLNATAGYGDISEQIVPVPPGGAGDTWSGYKLVTLEFTSKSKPKYSLIDLINVEYMTPDGKWHPVNEVIDGHYNPPPT